MNKYSKILQLPKGKGLRSKATLGHQEIISTIQQKDATTNLDMVKVGNTLERIDWLFLEYLDRRTFLPILEEQYGIKFEGRINPTSAISFTSMKCIISDVNGQKYFLKRKPQYSLIEPQKTRSALMQSTLTEYLSYIPKIILTQNGSFYAEIGGNCFLLTPYIKGNFFRGREEESISCAYTLGEIHKIASFTLPFQKDSIDSTKETLRFIKMAKELNFPNKKLKTFVLSKMEELTVKYKAINCGRRSWLHGDFTPYNMVFYKDKIIGVNDFDNVNYGAIARDIAECLFTHSGINYAGATSSLRAPIRTTIDETRMKKMLIKYLQSNPILKEELTDLQNQIPLIWLEHMALGLLRGDYSLKDVQIALPHCHVIYNAAKRLIAEIVKSHSSKFFQ